MKGLLIGQNGALLEAEFFEGSQLYLRKMNTGMIGKRNIYDALKGKDFLKRESRLSSKITFIGEVDEIMIDRKLTPFLSYHPIELVEGKKQYMPSKSVRLETSSQRDWFEFLLNPDSRKGYKGFGLYLPERYFLEKQEAH